MKAWEELKESVTFYKTGLFADPTSHWYLDHGVKIERFEKDGRFEIHNVMLAGDKYEKVSDVEYAMFDSVGWLAGCYNVCINTYRKRLNKINYMISLKSEGDDMLDDLMSRKAVVTKKLNRYLELMENLSTFATK
jgi:hypothetical protein